jgi:nucleoside-triphosphatase
MTLAQSIKNLLLTGPSGCGKTTVVRPVVERLAGFYTQEVRERGSRVGFEAVGIGPGHKALLAHVRSRSRLRVGRYGVEVAALAQPVEAELGQAVGEEDLFVIDEIGRMELLCPEFEDAVRRRLRPSGCPLVPVLATVVLKGVGLIAGAKAGPDVRLVEVAREQGLVAGGTGGVGKDSVLEGATMKVRPSAGWRAPAWDGLAVPLDPCPPGSTS